MGCCGFVDDTYMHIYMYTLLLLLTAAAAAVSSKNEQPRGTQRSEIDCRPGIYDESIHH